MGHNSNSHKLLSVVTTVHHQGVGETLNDWALCLSESLLSESTGGMGDVHGLSDLDVIAVEMIALVMYFLLQNSVVQICSIVPISRCLDASSTFSKSNRNRNKHRRENPYVNEISRISTSS